MTCSFSTDITKKNLNAHTRDAKNNSINQPSLTDTSVIPRQTHYACPFCMSKLEIATVNEKIISVKPTEYPIVFDSPAKCAHFSGLLHAPGETMLTQEECLICPKVLQCEKRKK